MNGHKVTFTWRLAFGLIVITLGILFTMDNLGMIDASQILRWWPILLVAYGLARVLGIGTQQNYLVGGLFAGVGGWFILQELGAVHNDPWDLWPLVLVVIGVSLVMRSLGAARGATAVAGASGGEDASSRLDAFAIWAGLERNVVSPDFRGGDVTAIMAGHEIDFRSAKIAGGGTAKIDLLVIMGGVDLRVPENWKVSSEAMLVMGGLEDHSRPPVGEVAGHLILRGVVLMGGIEVKN